VAPEGLKKVHKPELREFIEMCIEHNPERRPHVRQLLKHPFFESIRNGKSLLPAGDSSRHLLSSVVLSGMMVNGSRTPSTSGEGWGRQCGAGCCQQPVRIRAQCRQQQHAAWYVSLHTTMAGPHGCGHALHAQLSCCVALVPCGASAPVGHAC
jgi:hypothetical protein